MSTRNPHVRLAASQAEPFPVGRPELPRVTALYDQASKLDHIARAYLTLAVSAPRVIRPLLTRRARINREHATECRSYARHLQRQDGQPCSMHLVAPDQ